MAPSPPFSLPAVYLVAPNGEFARLWPKDVPIALLRCSFGPCSIFPASAAARCGRAVAAGWCHNRSSGTAATGACRLPAFTQWRRGGAERGCGKLSDLSLRVPSLRCAAMPSPAPSRSDRPGCGATVARSAVAHLAGRQCLPRAAACACCCLAVVQVPPGSGLIACTLLACIEFPRLAWRQEARGPAAFPDPARRCPWRAL